MNLLKDIVGDVKEELDLKDHRRENVFKLGRKIRRSSTKAIRFIHQEKFEEAKEHLDVSRELVSTLSESDYGFSLLQESVQEYAEAELTYAFIRGKEIPSFKDLGIPAGGYVLGLGDVVGEIRRYILDLMRKGDFDSVEGLLDLMDEITHEINSLDYPSAIVPIKRKQDMARILLEKTRGDVTMGLMLSRIEHDFNNESP